MSNADIKQANSRVMRKLLIAAVAMFGFGFALVPLYNAMCDVLGLNGRFIAIEQGTYDGSKAQSMISSVDETRTITVEFLASTAHNSPWEFRSMTSSMRLHPGEIKEVNFFAKNLLPTALVAHAVPSLSPGKAVKYFTKMECFCFQQQTFKAGEEKMMPLRFFVDPHLPRDVNTITIAYTFFESKKQAGNILGRTELASAQTVLTGTTANDLQ
ncbi:MAG: cytochrome c oxidase assembly protein [Gammaproteobacteria bacterium]|nr:cytochrome c oxidase assembly protein [Gammaproteobacteria bacterium]